MKTTITVIAALFVKTSVLSQDTLWTRASHPEQREVYGVAFSSDGNYILSGSECHKTHLRIFETITGTNTWDFEVDTTNYCTSSVKFSSDGLYLANMEELGKLEIYSRSGGTASLTSSVHTGTSGAYSVDFSPQSDKVVTGCTNNKMIIYSVPSGNVLHTVTAHSGSVLSVAWSHNGQYIATGGNDNLVKLWDTTGALIHTFTGHTGDANTVVFSPNDDYLISGSQDDKIKIWDISTHTAILTLSGHTQDIRQVDVSPNGKYIVSVSNDMTTKIWNFLTGNLVSSFSLAGAGKVYTCAWSPTEDKIVIGTQFNKVILWDVSTSVGINEINSKSTISVFPNPSTTSIYLSIEGLDNNNPVNIEIRDSTGKLVLFEQNFRLNEPINISKIKAGTYVISVNTKTYRSKIKFIKQ